MQLNAEKVRELRTQKAWTQQQLAEICGLSMRTIQRVEVNGIASLETSKALAAAFEIDRDQLLVKATTAPSTAVFEVPPWLLVVTFFAGLICGALLLRYLPPLLL